MGKSNFQILFNKNEKTERFAIAQMNKKQEWFGPVLRTVLVKLLAYFI